MSGSVPLSEVPYHFLDRTSWNDILSFAGGRQTALELLDAPNPDALPGFWDCTVPGSRLQDRRKLFQKGQMLSLAFREYLINDIHPGTNAVTADEVLGANSGDGFADLAALDSNGDGGIDANDAAFANLRLWVDANGCCNDIGLIGDALRPRLD